MNDEVVIGKLRWTHRADGGLTIEIPRGRRTTLGVVLTAEELIELREFADRAPGPPCCVCDPAECAGGDGRVPGEHCTYRACAWCLNGCPAGAAAGCCRAGLGRGEAVDGAEA